MYTRMRVVAAGAAVALIAGTAGAAAAASTSDAASPATSASNSSSSSSSPSAPAPKPSPTGTGQTGKPGDQWLVKLAASLHVSVQKLQAALIDAKQTIGRFGVAPTNPAVVSVVSHDLGISRDKATQLIKEVFGDAAPPGKGGPGKPGGKTPPPPRTPDPQVSQTLAGILHISVARAAQVLEQLDRIAPDRGVSPDDPQFRAIAASLHLTPQQLTDALVQMKQTLAGSMPAPSQSPVSVPSGGKG